MATESLPVRCEDRSLNHIVVAKFMRVQASRAERAPNAVRRVGGL